MTDLTDRASIIAAHDALAELHEHLAQCAVLDIIHEFHEDMAKRLRAEAASWRDMSDDVLASKLSRWTDESD